MTGILQVIARLPFQTARKTDRFGRPQIAHSYTVRNSGGTEEDYETLFDFIQTHGVVERFGRAKRKYLYVAGDKFWAMTTDRAESTIINRMRIEDDVERLRREGQPVRDANGRIVG